MDALLLKLACVPLLLAAVWCDARQRRIPNNLVLAGVIVAFLLHSWHPYGLGLGLCLAGALVGLAAFLPLYLVRMMGAGDVKLMAMVGAFLGPHDIFGALLATGLMGGGVALAVSLRVRIPLAFAGWGRLGHGAGESCAAMLATPERSRAPAARVPYGIAIGLGTVAYLVWQLHVGGGLS